MKLNFKDLFKITALPIFFASLCCLAPIVLVTLGLSTVAFGAALAGTLDGPYKPLFLGVGILGLIISSVLYFRKKGVCTLDQAKRHRNEIINTVLIITIVAVIGYILFFNVFLGLVGTQLKLWDGISWRP